MLLREVMNSKSSNHYRHAMDAYDIKKMSFYYAIESRIYKGKEEIDKNDVTRRIIVKTPLWFTNLMIFDFDFDEKHFPGLSEIELEEKLENALQKCEYLLGKPKYKIFNKKHEDITQFEIDMYFTKNGEINLPKKFGCQVVYELENSLQSQYFEQVNLYKEVRLHLSKLLGSDLDFKGHMFKNPFNRKLFNIEENQNFDTLNIFNLAEEFLLLDKEKINEIKELEAFKTFKSKEEVHPLFRRYSNRLYSFYKDLNSWKYNKKNKNFNCNLKEVIVDDFKKDSRNETLFSYMHLLPYENLENLSFELFENEISDYLFDKCSIKDPMDEKEFESTKQSVLSYKEKMGDSFSINFNSNDNRDDRVFKFDQNKWNLNFFNENF